MARGSTSWLRYFSTADDGRTISDLSGASCVITLSASAKPRKLISESPARLRSGSIASRLRIVPVNEPVGAESGKVAIRSVVKPEAPIEKANSYSAAKPSGSSKALRRACANFVAEVKRASRSFASAFMTTDSTAAGISGRAAVMGGGGVLI